MCKYFQPLQKGAKQNPSHAKHSRISTGKLNKTHMYLSILAAHAITRPKKNAVCFVHHGLQL